jgi:uncharacterized protein YeaO (DUF488 family)
LKPGRLELIRQRAKFTDKLMTQNRPMPYDIQLKRIYDKGAADDGARVLTDRLWPRGLRRERLDLAQWYTKAAPPAPMRKAYHQQKLTEQEFSAAYKTWLQAHPELLTPLLCLARQGRLTLLTATRDAQHSYLFILRESITTELMREDEQADGHETASPVCYASMFEAQDKD